MKEKCILLVAALFSAALFARTPMLESAEAFGVYADEKRCYLEVDGGKASIVNLMVAAYDMSDVDKALVMDALKTAVERDCDMNERDMAGLTPLHAAVLFNSPAVVEFLLENGGDAALPIIRPDSPIDGKTAAEFLEFLLLKDADSGNIKDRSRIQALLAKVQSRREKE